MGLTAAVVLGVSAGFSASASISSGNAQKKLADYNAKVAKNNATTVENLADYNAKVQENNALISDAQSTDAVARGEQAVTIQRQAVKGVIGSQRAAQGASGVDVNDGSSLDVQADTAYTGELDAITIRANAAREAWGYQVAASNERASAVSARLQGKAQANNYRTQSEDLTVQGQMAKAAGINQGIGTILTSGADLLKNTYGVGNGKGAKK